MTSIRTRIAHISDPHFGTTTPEKVACLVKALHQLKPDLIALSGDVTQRARRQQFLEARNFCESLSPFTVVAVPGNHDIPLFNLPARFFWPYHDFKHILKKTVASQKKLAGVELLAINSTDPMRHVQGDLTDRDRHQLTQFANDSLFRIVMLHHPLDCAKEVDEKNLLKQSENALALFENEKVDLVLSGHIHDPLARLSNIRYPESQRPLVFALAGTCLSSRTREGAPNSFNCIDIKMELQTAELNITRYDLDPDGTFKPLHQAQFFRNGRDQWT